MLRIVANHKNPALATDDFAFITNSFCRRSDLHPVRLLLINKRAFTAVDATPSGACEFAAVV